MYCVWFFRYISNEDNIWDLRYIPFILGGLYGGYKLGLIQIGIALLIRFLLGGLGFYSAAVVHYYYRNCHLYPFQLLFKNEFEAKTFPFSDIIGHWDDHFANYWNSFSSRII